MNRHTCLTEQQINIIHKIPLFKGLSDEQKKSLLDKLDYATYVIKKGDTIIRQGTVCSHLNILLEGLLDVNIVDVTGNSFKVEDIIAPRAFATPHLFNDDNNIYPATFTVVEDGVLLRATKESVFSLLTCMPELLKNFLRVTGNCNVCTVSRLRILSYKSIRSRFISYLFDHKKEAVISVMRHNQTQLAEYMGVTRPALANEISKMEKEGLIQVDGKTVKLNDVQALMQYL